MYITISEKNPKPLTKTLGCDSPHNPKKCLKKCINDSNIIYLTCDLKNLFVSDGLSLIQLFFHDP